MFLQVSCKYRKFRTLLVQREQNEHYVAQSCDCKDSKDHNGKFKKWRTMLIISTRMRSQLLVPNTDESIETYSMFMLEDS